MACSTACPPRHDLLISENGNLATFDKVKKKKKVWYHAQACRWGNVEIRLNGYYFYTRVQKIGKADILRASDIQ